MPQARTPGKQSDYLPTEDAAPALPYVIELREPGRPPKRRILGRAGDLRVAEEIFRAAVEQYPAGLVVLRHGREVLMRSGG